MSYYASQSPMIYWAEISPGKFVRRIKEVTKATFSNELGICYKRINPKKGNRATK